MTPAVRRRAGVHPTQKELASLDHVGTHHRLQAVRVAAGDRRRDRLVLSDKRRCVRGELLVREDDSAGEDLEGIEAIE
jgi:hypothetical protein